MRCAVKLPRQEHFNSAKYLTSANNESQAFVRKTQRIESALIIIRVVKSCCWFVDGIRSQCWCLFSVEFLFLFRTQMIYVYVLLLFVVGRDTEVNVIFVVMVTVATVDDDDREILLNFPNYCTTKKNCLHKKRRLRKGKRNETKCRKWFLTISQPSANSATDIRILH